MKRTRILVAASLMLIVMLAIGSIGCAAPKGCSTAVPGQNGGTSSGAGNGSSTGASACSSTNSTGTGTGTGGGTYLFIADAGGIQGEMLNPSAAKVSVTSNWNTVNVDTNVPGSWMAVSQAKYEYVAYPGVGQIYGFAIAQDGTVAFLNSGVAFAASYLVGGSAGGSQAMIANPAGTLLFVLDSTLEQVHIYQIGSGGGLTEASNSPVYLPSGFQPYNLAMDGLGAYLYVSNINNLSVTTEVAGFSVASDGSLTALPNSPFTTNLQQMQGDSSGKYMVGTSAGTFVADNHVYLSTIGSNGTLSTPVAYPTSDSPLTLTVQPNQGGTLVYTFDLSGGVEGFQIDTSKGTLVTLIGSPFNIPGASGQFDPAGQYLFVAEQSINNPTNILDVYDVSSSTNLTTFFASVGWSSGAWAVTDTP